MDVHCLVGGFVEHRGIMDPAWQNLAVTLSCYMI